LRRAKKFNILAKCYKVPKLQHLPNSLQLLSHELTLTFQLYCGLLLGVNCDIQTVLWSFRVVRWTGGSLQNGKELVGLNLRRIMVVCSTFLYDTRHTIYRAKGRAETLPFFKNLSLG
jgi:hypothetical protein